jgi:hypothetical protein
MIKEFFFEDARVSISQSQPYPLFSEISRASSRAIALAKSKIFPSQASTGVLHFYTHQHKLYEPRNCIIKNR